MIKALSVLMFVAIGTLGPSKCTKTVVHSDACGVIRETLYSDGRFNFTDSEVDALSETNQIKIDAAKRYYRTYCKSP